MKTAPQIVYSGLGNKNLTPTQEGGCRRCGGLLLGETGEYQKLVSDSGRMKVIIGLKQWSGMRSLCWPAKVL